jgi:hypothetical protein
VCSLTSVAVLLLSLGRKVACRSYATTRLVATDDQFSFSFVQIALVSCFHLPFLLFIPSAPVHDICWFCTRNRYRALRVQTTVACKQQ